MVGRIPAFGILIVILGSLAYWVNHVNRQDFARLFEDTKRASEDRAAGAAEVSRQARMLEDWAGLILSTRPEDLQQKVQTDSLIWVGTRRSMLDSTAQVAAVAADSSAMRLLSVAAWTIARSREILDAAMAETPVLKEDSLRAEAFSTLGADSLETILSRYHGKFSRYAAQASSLAFLSVPDRKSYPDYSWIENIHVFPDERCCGVSDSE